MGRDCATASKLWRALTSHRDPEDHVVVALARSMAFRGLGKVGYVGKIVAKHDWPQRSRPLEERHEQNAHECSCEDNFRSPSFRRKRLGLRRNGCELLV
jgi:hypothetical protein